MQIGITSPAFGNFLNGQVKEGKLGESWSGQY